jgi:hypothetical protein
MNIYSSLTPTFLYAFVYDNLFRLNVYFLRVLASHFLPSPDPLVSYKNFHCLQSLRIFLFRSLANLLFLTFLYGACTYHRLSRVKNLLLDDRLKMHEHFMT